VHSGVTFPLPAGLIVSRGLYVDVTRARDNVTIGYGKDDVQDFGDLLVRAQRDNGKVLVREVVRGVNVRLEQEQKDRSRLGPWHRKRQVRYYLGPLCTVANARRTQKRAALYSPSARVV